MFFFNFLAEYTILWWIGIILLLPVTLFTALNAHKDRFGACIALSLLGATLVHLLGLANLIELVTTNWMWLVGGAAAYLILSFPYARFVEWRRYLVHAYEKRVREEKDLLARFNTEMSCQWQSQLWQAHVSELASKDRTLDRSSPYFDGRRFDNLRNDFLRSPELETRWSEYEKSPEFQSKWEAHLEESGLRKPIRASQHKALIVGWMVYWPYKLMYRVLVQWVIEFLERIKDLFRIVVERLMHLLQRDSDRAFEKYLTARKEDSHEVT